MRLRRVRAGYPPCMPFLARVLDRGSRRIERMSQLDPIADRLSALARPVLPDGPIRDAASGTPIGHPAHPALVAVPMGAWLAAGYLDIAGPAGSRPIAQRLIGLGVLAAVPTAATGISDWLDTEGAERRVGLAHWALNYTAISFYAGSWLARRRGRHGTGTALAVVGMSVLGAGGWLGGHLAYALGVGVDTTAFQQLPDEWHHVASSDDVPMDRPVKVFVNGVALVLVRQSDGVHALADRCSHRGGPLDEGTVTDGCLVCPWHASRFDILDGSVRRGPATRPQSTLEVREVGDRVEVRRGAEERSLRVNPVGV